MKKNPYKIVETVLFVLLALAMISAVLTVVHVTSSWKSIGVCIGIVLLFIAVMWFTSWWAEQRNKWDQKHRS